MVLQRLLLAPLHPLLPSPLVSQPQELHLSWHGIMEGVLLLLLLLSQLRRLSCCSSHWDSIRWCRAGRPRQRGGAGGGGEAPPSIYPLRGGH